MSLTDLLKKHGLSQRKFGETLEPKATQGLVWQWIHGETRVTLEYANAIVKRYPEITHDELAALYQQQPAEAISDRDVVMER